MATDPAQLSPGKRKRYQRSFYSSLLYEADRHRPGTVQDVEDLIVLAGFAGAVYLFHNTTGIKSIGLVRCEELAGTWLASLPPGRCAAYAKLPLELSTALCADSQAKSEISHLLSLNDIMGDKMSYLLKEEPEKLARVFFPKKKPASVLEKEKDKLLRLLQSTNLLLQEIDTDLKQAGLIENEPESRPDDAKI